MDFTHTHTHTVMETTAGGLHTHRVMETTAGGLPVVGATLEGAGTLILSQKVLLTVPV